MLQQYQTVREIFFRFRAKLRWKKREEYCCVVQMHRSEHTRRFRWFRSDAVVFRLFKVFSSSLQHIWRTYRANIRDQLIENTAIVSVDVILSIWNSVFRVQISDCYSMCLQFVCKQSDKNHSVHGSPFLVVIFQHFFFSVWWLYLKINHSLVAEIIYTKYSFIHARTQHNISNKNSFQQCFIFDWSA